MLFLGIDGGGTRCRARIRDDAGRFVGEGEGGPANIYQDLPAAATSVMAAATQASEHAGLTAEVLRQLHAGLGVAGIITADSAHRLRASGLQFASLAVALDAHAACLGAHGGNDGGIVIAGTGSAGFAIIGGLPKGIGGWGFALGDAGSGAIMGREAVRRAVLALDGLTIWSPLLEQVLAVLGREQSPLTEWAKSARPTDYAQFAPAVLAGAATGDTHAMKIVRDAARAIGDLARELKALGAPHLSLLGGLAKPLTPFLTEEVRAMLAPPMADAMDGAIFLAKHARTATEQFAGGVSRA